MEINEMKLREKLANIQQEVKAPKDLKNDFAGYKFRNAEKIEEIVKPICFKYRTTLTLSDEVVQKGDRYYCIATATLTDWDSDDYKIVRAEAREQEQQKGLSEAQITGSVSSYSRKYCLCGMFLIDDSTSDPDAMDTRDEGNKTPLTKEQFEFICANSKWITDDLKALHIKSNKELSKLSIEQASGLIQIAQEKMMKND